MIPTGAATRGQTDPQPCQKAAAGQPAQAGLAQGQRLGPAPDGMRRRTLAAEIDHRDRLH